MSPKLLLFARSLVLKSIVLFFFLVSFEMAAQSTVSRIITDWKGYWSSTTTTGVGNRPDDVNNLLAFTWHGTTYSTGVNNTILNNNSVTYNAQRFRALKIQTLGSTSSMYFLQGSMIDGSASTATLVPPIAGSTATGAELASRLTDGTNGLTLGTGIANIKAGTAEFKIGTNNLNLSGLGDGIPDLIVTQVADPGGSTPDTFKFIDALGNTVGTELSINFNSVNAVGTYSLDLFKMDGTVGFPAASTRDIRVLGIETSEFGITSANAAQVDRFVVTFSGSSDCAFIAFNTNSLKIAELSLIKKASMASCGKVGDVINYTFDIKNTGEVPITDINVTDPMPGLVITGNPISSLAVGATATVTGTYTITAADVNLGRVINSAKVTGTDPSLNIVEDISGQTYTDNIATTIDLLAPPTIGTITNTTCTALGTVVLNNLPSTGTWTVERSPGLVTTTGTGTTATITGIPAGTYTFRVTNSTGCKSPASASAVITDQSSTTWNGTAWSNGTPTSTKGAVFTGAYTITADLTACSCTINSPVNMVVPSGITLNIVNGLTVNSGASLVFNNNSSLVQTNTGTNINTGNITYRRDTQPVRRYDYTYWSSPITAAPAFTLANLSPATLGDKYYSYNPSTGWVINYNGTLTMAKGTGYIVRAPQTFSIVTPAVYSASFIGVPNNGNTTIAVSPNSWNLIGNPYPSAIDATSLITSNSTIGTLYFWTHNLPPSGSVPGDAIYNYTASDYAVFNLLGSTGTASGSPAPNGYISAGQAFFTNTGSGSSITFTNTMRVAGNNTQFYKTANTNAIERNRIWLNFTNAEGAFKQALVGYAGGATNNWDLQYDAITLDGNTYIDFYSINDNTSLTIQARALPFDDADVVPMGYKATVAGEFTIAIDHTDGLFNQQAIYLEDKKANIIHDLKASDYKFNTETGTFTDRFVLRYTNKNLGTGDFENTEDALLISVKDKTIKIISSKETIKEVNIYDISGKLLYSKKKIGAAEFSISNLQAADQVLVVKTVLENNALLTRKIIFK
ncbi:T9SS sorting signal type C domain-containing protein [Flavobacterium endoglycinae]|uniref:T9SS sorting signal type C domain-containing protein n=1 Tax=Flavobacterium endoglycinae TaxID=2816357 RepID=A0ABX7Q7P8_9FLAO|nr:T9SS sorting signal type C domain-containing protein [Flavobacterium endoglycinae]QSW87049.1 T9SS sorting signal type C domain-containing protein [Flavobacterium endoglycinae]